MNHNQFKVFINQIPKLDPVQKQQAITSLNQQDNPILNRLAKENIQHSKCIHCDSKRIKKHGKSNGRQRFFCNQCGKSFVCTRGTAFFYQHKPEHWQAYLELMLKRETIRACAEKIGVSTVTAFNWRHRYMQATQHTFEAKLEGIIEVDEMYFRESQKGNKKLTRPARKRGTNASTHGLNNKDWVAVLTAMDRNHHEYDHVLQQVNGTEINNCLGCKIVNESILCSDGQPAYNKICQEHHLHHVVLKHAQPHNTVFHIQNINSYHSYLKQWMLQMHGVASKNLPKYLGWFRMLAWHKYQSFSDDFLTQREKLFEFKLLQVQQHNF
ncbi:MAG: IS1595 family transposase [Saccharospirillaceae bacterium]|nr:IS1595 family transposase [Pseudomonadales bacterium]NRB81320.1 IS1595 family transposase [Saccharospirillaceae bacterium]